MTRKRPYLWIWRGLCEADDDDYSREVFLNIEFEYLRLPTSEVWVAPDPEFGQFFYWPERFDLLLMLQFSAAISVGRLDQTEIGDMLSYLKNCKFMEVATPIYAYEDRPVIFDWLRKLKQTLTAPTPNLPDRADFPF